MDKQQIIDYIMHTPSNTNPAMLGQFLDEYSGGSGESWSTFFEGEVTTVEEEGSYFTQLSNSNYIDADKIKVTFNNVEYICNKTAINDGGDIGNIYGGSYNEEYEQPDFSNYPFIIVSWDWSPRNETYLNTESPGTYSIKIEVPQESGDSGDWSTAEVTFINYTTILGTVRYVSIVRNSFLGVDNVVIFNASPKVNPPYTTILCRIPLYKNGYVLSSSDFSENLNNTLITTTGDIIEDEGEYLITGDCTITFNLGETALVTPAQ